jgi:hypothetical protein
MVSEVLLELFGLAVSPALVDQTVHQAARSVAPLEQALADDLAKAALVYADETSWTESALKLWLWVICSGTTVLYLIGSRCREMLDNVLALDFGGTLMSDGYVAYRNRLLRLRCWAHLHRKTRGLAESTDRQVARAGATMQQLVEDLMEAVFKAREAQGPPPSVTHAAQIEQLRQLCEQHRDAKPKALRDLAREFLYDWDVIGRPLVEPQLPLSRVEMWRGGSRSRHRCFRPFRLAVPYEPDRSSVSTSPSSNRTCATNASGSLPTHQAFAFERSRADGIRRISPNFS